MSEHPTKPAFAAPAKIDEKAVIAGFGDEWQRFPQDDLDPTEVEKLASSYFHVFPWHKLPADARGFDAGCGSGRWARFVAPRVGHLTCIDASPAALAVAKKNLSFCHNAALVCCDVQAPPFAPSSQDFGYSLGVLHHVLDTPGAISALAKCLKPGAPLLLYLYYAFDNRPAWYRGLWKTSEIIRNAVSRLPFRTRYLVSQLIAATVYWPLARTAALAETVSISPHHFPLAFYRHLSFYTMRTDALDRFGTSLENRFTRSQILSMMTDAGLGEVRFSEKTPYWCAVAIKT